MTLYPQQSRDDSNGHTTAPPLFLGIDFGTSGCRGLLIDDQGLVQGQATVALPLPERRPIGTGAHSRIGIEQRGDTWLTALETVLDSLPRALLGRVAAVAVDGTSSTLLVTDRDGRALAPALMYNDGRATEQAQRIASCATTETGAGGAGSSLAKLLWLLQQHPNAAHALHQADWACGWLRGEYGDSDENNCLKLGYDPLNRCWPAWVRQLLPSPQILPRVVPPGTPIGQIDSTIAARFGLAATTCVVSGTTDSTAAFIATGADTIGDAVTTLGSTLVLKVLSAKPITSPRHGVYSHRLGDLWLVGGASNSGGAVLRREFSDPDIARRSMQLDFSQPTGLDYYPLPGPGERFPIADPDQPPRMQPRPDDPQRFFQAILEGIAAIEQQGYQTLASLGAPYPTRVISSGGGAVNRAWGEMRSQLLGIPESAATHTDAAYGSALLARQGVTKK